LVATLSGGGQHKHPTDIDTPEDYQRLVGHHSIG
jgi:hypothetical protein